MCSTITVTKQGQPFGGRTKILFLILPLVALGIGLYKQREVQDKSVLLTPSTGKVKIFLINALL